jgi:hypothetical protein
MKFPLTKTRALLSLVIFLIPLYVRAQSPDSAEPAAPPSSTGNAGKKPAPRPHRVFTNDDIPSRTPGNSTPEIEARLQQLNLCDRACFAQVFKDSQQAFRQRYNYSYPFSGKDDHAFEDAILGRMASLRGNSEWQTLLRNALIAKDAFCRQSSAAQQQSARDRRNDRPVTSADIAAEADAAAAAAKDARPMPNYNSASSAIIGYKFKIEKDFLLAAIVLYKYFEIVRPGCSVNASEE